MSTRRQRAEKRNRLRCRACGALGARHLDPFTRTYICQITADADPAEEASDA